MRENALSILRQVRVFPAGTKVKHVSSDRVYTVDHVRIQGDNLFVHVEDNQDFPSKELLPIDSISDEK